MQAIYDRELSYHKTQAIQFQDNIIDTPGEYLEQRFRYRSLGITAANTDLIVLVQSCADYRCVFAPGLASMFAKPMVGVVTKIDLAKSQQDLERSVKYLKLAGVQRNFSGEQPDKGWNCRIRIILKWNKKRSFCCGLIKQQEDCFFAEIPRITEKILVIYSSLCYDISCI